MSQHLNYMPKELTLTFFLYYRPLEDFLYQNLNHTLIDSVYF